MSTPMAGHGTAMVRTRPLAAFKTAAVCIMSLRELEKESFNWIRSPVRPACREAYADKLRPKLLCGRASRSDSREPSQRRDVRALPASARSNGCRRRVRHDLPQLLTP